MSGLFALYGEQVLISGTQRIERNGRVNKVCTFGALH
jgi:hypothetical protein